MKRYVAIDLVMVKQLNITLLDWVLLENIHFMQNNPTGYCYASKETLADIIGVSRKTIYRMIEKLENVFIEKEFKTGNLKVSNLWEKVASGTQYQNDTDCIKMTQTQYQTDTNIVSKRPLKEDIKEENKGEARALDFLMNNSPSDYEVFLIQNKKNIKDFEKFTKDFNDKVDIEGLEFTSKKIKARLNIFARNWIENKNKFNKSEDEKVIPIYRRKIS